MKFVRNIEKEVNNFEKIKYNFKSPYLMKNFLITSTIYYP